MFCFVQAKTLRRYVWLYVFLGYTLACVDRCDGDVICVGHDMNRSSGMVVCLQCKC